MLIVRNHSATFRTALSPSPYFLLRWVTQSFITAHWRLRRELCKEGVRGKLDTMSIFHCCHESSRQKMTVCSCVWMKILYLLLRDWLPYLVKEKPSGGRGVNCCWAVGMFSTELYEETETLTYSLMRCFQHNLSSELSFSFACKTMILFVYLSFYLWIKHAGP